MVSFDLAHHMSVFQDAICYLFGLSTDAPKNILSGPEKIQIERALQNIPHLATQAHILKPTERASVYTYEFT